MSDGATETLAETIRRLIARDGAMPVSRFMALCLAEPTRGYYASRDPLGSAGDFTTAPEISQMFGELIGLWAVVTWQLSGAPERFHLVELGPGRGTLMVDALRAAAGASNAFMKAATVHLVETSPVLRDRQARHLGTYAPLWHDRLEDVPEGPSIVIANEFLDALPVSQYVRRNGEWHERLVGVDETGQLRLVLADRPAPTLAPLTMPAGRDGDVCEVNWPALAVAETVATRLCGQGGAALFIDYGYDRSAAGDTLQAVKDHDFHPILEAPGEADLTAHVDFGRFANAARSCGSSTWGPVAQGAFLSRLGIEARAAALKKNSDGTTRDTIDAALQRLIGDDGMGTLFRVLGLTSPSIAELPGFVTEESSVG